MDRLYAETVLYKGAWADFSAKYSVVFPNVDRPSGFEVLTDHDTDLHRERITARVEDLERTIADLQRRVANHLERNTVLPIPTTKIGRAAEVDVLADAMYRVRIAALSSFGPSALLSIHLVEADPELAAHVVAVEIGSSGISTSTERMEREERLFSEVGAALEPEISALVQVLVRYVPD